jgi:tetratricopeptide (TPR) repeat protein
MFDQQKEHFYLNQLLSKLLEVDQANEAAASRLMRLLARGGRRVEALRIYQQLKESLKALDLPPLPQTRTLYESIRRGLGSGKLTIGNSTFIDEQIRGQHPPLAGRKDELRHLQKYLYSTPLQKKAGTKLLLLTGDIGVGKSRLAEELSQQATNQGWLTTWARGYRQESSLPYRFWVETLKQILPFAKKEILQESNLALLLPELWQEAPPINLDPSLKQLQLQEAMCRLLQRLQAKISLLIIFDDIQWIDGPSLGMLIYLLRHLQERPSPVFLATGRSLELSSPEFREVRANLQSEGLENEMHISPLSGDEILTLLESLPLNKAIDQHQVQERAMGNPLFAISLASIAGRNTGLPQTINAAFDVLLQGLHPDNIKLLRAASIIASYGNLNVVRLEKMLGEQEALDSLDTLLQLGLLEEHDGFLYFWHQLLTEHLYQSLTASRKTYLHRQAAAILEEEEEAPAIILLHLQRGGGNPKQIFHYARLAGERAMSVCAYKEAEHYLRTALNHLENETEQNTHLIILLQLAESRRIQGDFEEARQLYTDILKLFLSNTDPAANKPTFQALLWREIAHTWYENGNVQIAWSCCDEGIALLREANIDKEQAPGIWGALTHERALSLWSQGKYHEAYREAHEALHLLEQALLELRSNPSPKTQTPLAPYIPRMQSDLIDLGRVCSLIGVLTAILHSTQDPTHYFRRAAAIFKQANSLRELSSALGNIGNVHLVHAELTEAADQFQEGVKIAERLGDNPVLSVMSINLAITAYRQGDIDKAFQLYTQALSLVRTDALDESVFSYGFASCYLDLGYQDALPYITRALHAARTADHNAPCFALVLAATGQARLAQSRQAHTHKEKELLLASAKRLTNAALQRSMEPEYRREIEITRASIALAQGQVDIANYQLQETYEDARASNIHWSAIRAREGIARIHLLREEYTEAEAILSPLLEECQKRQLGIERLRTLRLYGKALFKQGKDEGIAYIQEAENAIGELLGEHSQDFPW